MNEELKPCPFCGGEARIDREDVFCDCGARILIEPFYYEQPISMPEKDRLKSAKQEAIAAWNRRADINESVL